MTYGQDYFEEGIFNTDYEILAQIIINNHHPSRVIEFGCGPGHLTRALAKRGIEVLALDGFSNPNFDEFDTIIFKKLNIDDESQMAEYLNIDFKKFDLAICTEVAEHILLSSSKNIIHALTNCANIVIFSAAVPEQGGHGHINCQSRLFWHKIFSEYNFQIIDSLRKDLYQQSNLAIWYKLNTIDYIKKDLKEIDFNNIINNLVLSESQSSSSYYQKSIEANKHLAYLNYPFIKQYLLLRNFLKKIVK